ncbi:MAG: hypothetical protein AB7O59_15130 [Pirellulales bacterium]
MGRPNFLLKMAGVVLGSVGTALCLALIVLAWIAGNRFGRATESLFGSADRALIAVQQRVDRTRQHVAAAQKTAADVERSLLDWTQRDASRRQELQLAAAARTEQLANALEQADLWLEVAESSVGLVRESLASGTLARSPTSTTFVDRLIEELASLRTQLTTATEVVTQIQERLAGRSGESLEARMNQGVPLAQRVAAMISTMDSRFGKVEERLSVARGQLLDLGLRAQWWILFATMGVTLFLLWMAAGQVALCWLAWTG